MIEFPLYSICPSQETIDKFRIQAFELFPNGEICSYF